MTFFATLHSTSLIFSFLHFEFSFFDKILALPSAIWYSGYKNLGHAIKMNFGKSYFCNCSESCISTHISKNVQMDIWIQRET